MTGIKIPDGMKPHNGSAKVPDDYDGGAVMLRAGLMTSPDDWDRYDPDEWDWSLNNLPQYSIIAYTPKAESSAETQAAMRAVQQGDVQTFVSVDALMDDLNDVKPAQDDAMLKPCPFCGGGDITIIKDPRDQWGPWFVALCGNELCHMLGPAGRTDVEARSKWNTRTTADAARIAKLEADNARLREDFRNCSEKELMSSCEQCGALFLDGDDYVTDDDGVAGCWHAMTGQHHPLPRPCYAYRVGKQSASDRYCAPLAATEARDGQ